MVQLQSFQLNLIYVESGVCLIKPTICLKYQNKIFRMGLFRFLFKWSLQITGSAIVGYHYGLKPEKQAELYGFYRSGLNSYRAAKQIYAATNEYKGLIALQKNPEQYKKQLSQVNSNTARRIQQLSRLNKGVYMRLGQYMGHLKYAFSSQFNNVLKELNQRPNYQAEDYKYLKKHIQAQLGKTTRQLFETLNTSPIKSDLFYQIYKGQLAENFLDVNLKVVHPYAKSQTKLDFWFLNKAVEYINQFKEKNFAQKQPLYLDLLYSNLKLNVEKQLNLKDKQQTTLKVKGMLEQLVSQQKNKVNTRALPVYVPYIYQQYTKQNIIIQEYFEGQHLSNIDAIFKDNFNIKTISQDVVGIWNGIFSKSQLVLEQYRPFDLFIRKSRANQEGPYQICPLDLSQVSQTPEFISKPYQAMWKQLIQSKKLDPKKPELRVNSIRTFYQNLPHIYFCIFLNEDQSVRQLIEKAKLAPISQDRSSQLLNVAKDGLSKQISKKLEEKKILKANKSKTVANQELQRDYDNLKRAFEIQYQPWKLQTIFHTYKEIFRQQKHFGII